MMFYAYLLIGLVIIGGKNYVLAQDIDECATNADNCDVNANCTNTIEAFTCTCKVGYTGNGVTCTDINECNSPTACGQTAQCDNTQGSFTCTCNNGFNWNGISCTDINECLSVANNCHVDANCTNTIGSFTCACKVGYTGNGVTCELGPPCNSSPCMFGGTCTRINDTAFSCACVDGYYGPACEYRDGCFFDKPCQNNGICQRRPSGAFKCVCVGTFTGRICEICNE